MGLPAVGVQLLSFLIISFITTTWRRTRLNCIAGLHVNSLFGILLVKLLPEEKKWGRLVGFWLVRAYMPMLPLTLTLLASNTAGFTKKATTGAMLFIGYCVGNLVGPQFFLSSEAPDYQVCGSPPTPHGAWLLTGVDCVYYLDDLLCAYNFSVCRDEGVPQMGEPSQRPGTGDAC